MAENKEVEVLSFASINIPTPAESYEKSDDKFVTWGSGAYYNLYHNYLLRLYGESPIHASIINKKASMIVGNGLKYVNGSPVEVNVNPADTLDEFVIKVVKDFAIYNAFTIEVIYNKLNQPIEYHFIPFQQIRMNKSKTKFWWKDSWKLNTKEIIYNRWKYNNTDSTSKIFYYDGYIPTLSNVYAEPEYKSILKTLETDIAIRDFNLNNIKNHFSVSTLITFFMGSNVQEEIKRKIISDLQNSYTGENGKKLIVDFKDPNTPAADVKNLSPNDWDKAYEMIRKGVQEEIYQGHQVTSPMLFGVKTEGQLGGSTELETSHEIFKNDYILSKRNEISSALNRLFTGSTIITNKVEFEDKKMFSTALSEASKLKIYSINELRQLQGLPARPDGDKLLQEIDKPATAPVSQGLSSFSKSVIELKEEDFEKIKDLGIQFDDFDFLADGEFISSKEDFKRVELEFEQSQEIADYILENKITNQSIADLKIGLRKDLGINISINDLKSTISQLNDAGVINISITNDVLDIKPIEKEAPSRKIEVMYSYEVRTGLGEPIIEGTRPFCKRLIENNRLYSLQDVQTMSSIFGYDIFTFGGGYFHDSDKGITTPHCRHFFKSKSVVRKTK